MSRLEPIDLTNDTDIQDGKEEMYGRFWEEFSTPKLSKSQIEMMGKINQDREKDRSQVAKVEKNSHMKKRYDEQKELRNDDDELKKVPEVIGIFEPGNTIVQPPNYDQNVIWHGGCPGTCHFECQATNDSPPIPIPTFSSNIISFSH